MRLSRAVNRDIARLLLLPCAAAAILLAGWFGLHQVRAGPKSVSCGSTVKVALHREIVSDADFFGPGYLRLIRYLADASHQRNLAPPSIHPKCWTAAGGNVLNGAALAGLAIILGCFFALTRRIERPAPGRQERTSPDTEHFPRSAHRRSDNNVLYWILLGGLLVVAGIAGRFIQAGAQWHFIRSVNLLPIVVTFGLVTGVLVFASAATRLATSSERPVLLLTVLGGGLLQLLMFGVGRHSLTEWIAVNDYKRLAAQYNVRYLLRNYVRIADTLPLHQRANMPGKLITYRLIGYVTTSDVALAFILIMISAIGGALLYFLGRRLRLSCTSALSATLLYFFIPARTAYLPSPNNLTSVLGIGLLLLLLTYRDTRRKVPVLLALGIAVYCTAVFDPSPLLLLPIGAVIMLRQPAPGRLTVKGFVPLIAVPAVVFLCIHSAMRVGLGFDIFDALSHVARDARSFNDYQRPNYAEWFIPNLREFFVNAGYASSLLVSATTVSMSAIFVFRVLMRLGHEQPAITTRVTSLAEGPRLLASGLIGEIVILDVLGLNRGEVSRLWLYLAVLMPLVIAGLIAGPPGRRLFQAVLILSVVQTIFLVNMVSFSTFSFFEAFVAPKPMLHPWTWIIDAFSVLFLAYMTLEALQARHQRSDRRLPVPLRDQSERVSSPDGL